MGAGLGVLVGVIVDVELGISVAVDTGSGEALGGGKVGKSAGPQADRINDPAMSRNARLDRNWDGMVSIFI